MISFDQLYEWRLAQAKAAIDRGEETFLGLPEKWFEHPHWFCESGHVSGTVLKVTSTGSNVCLECRKPVMIGPRLNETEFRSEIARIKRVTIRQTHQG